MRAMLVACAVVLSACGTEGPAGPPGPKGEPGGSLTATYFCSAEISSQASAYYFRYEFSDGGVITSCTIFDNEFEVGRTFVYGANQVGAQNGLCVLLRDADAPSAGYWTFNHATGQASATVKYVDPGSVNDGRVFTLSCQRP